MASQQASQSMLERIKRSDLPQSQVYVAEQMKTKMKSEMKIITLQRSKERIYDVNQS